MKVIIPFSIQQTEEKNMSRVNLGLRCKKIDSYVNGHPKTGDMIYLETARQRGHD